MFYFRTCDCLAYVRIPNRKRVKVASRACECVFIGYALNSKSYRFYEQKAKVIIKSNDTDFYETKFPFISRDNGGANLNITPDHTPVNRDNDENIQPDVIELQRSKRARTAKKY